MSQPNCTYRRQCARRVQPTGRDQGPAASSQPRIPQVPSLSCLLSLRYLVPFYSLSSPVSSCLSQQASNKTAVTDPPCPTHLDSRDPWDSNPHFWGQRCAPTGLADRARLVPREVQAFKVCVSILQSRTQTCQGGQPPPSHQRSPQQK